MGSIQEFLLYEALYFFFKNHCINEITEVE